MTRIEFHASDFNFENPSDATLSFLTDSSTSCPNSATSSRRSSEISFVGSSSSFSPTSPVSSVTLCDDRLTPSCNIPARFPSTRLPFLENEVATLDLADSLRPDQCMIPSAMLYASVNFNGHAAPHEYPVSGLDFYQEDAPDVRTLGSDLPIDVESRQLTAYPNDIGAVILDESAISYIHPPFIVPSQMLRNNDSQGESITDPFLAGSSGVAGAFRESHYETENTVVPAAEYKESGAIMSSRVNKTRSTQKSHRIRNRSGDARSLQKNTDAMVAGIPFKNAIATRKKKYKCDQCAKGFDRQEHFKRHQISDSHRNMIAKSGKNRPKLEKIFSCQACSKEFNRHDNLRPHIKTHLMTMGRNSRKDPVSVEQSWKYGWEDLDPRISAAEVKRGRAERLRRATGG